MGKWILSITVIILVIYTLLVTTPNIDIKMWCNLECKNSRRKEAIKTISVPEDMKLLTEGEQPKGGIISKIEWERTYENTNNNNAICENLKYAWSKDTEWTLIQEYYNKRYAETQQHKEIEICEYKIRSEKYNVECTMQYNGLILTIKCD